MDSQLQSCCSCRGGCDGSKATGANLMAGSLGWLHSLPRGRWHGDMRQVGTGTMLQQLCGPSLGKPKDTAAPGTLGERSLLELGSPHPDPAVLGAEGISSGMVLPPTPQKTERAWAGPIFWVEGQNANCLMVGNLCLCVLGIYPPGSSCRAGAQPMPPSSWPVRFERNAYGSP